jgi:hypothetical protein
LTDADHILTPRFKDKQSRNHSRGRTAETVPTADNSALAFIDEAPALADDPSGGASDAAMDLPVEEILPLKVKNKQKVGGLSSAPDADQEIGTISTRKEIWLHRRATTATEEHHGRRGKLSARKHQLGELDSQPNHIQVARHWNSTIGKF